MTKNSWFLLLRRLFLPTIFCLLVGRYVTRESMQLDNQSSELRQLIKDARWAIWLFVIINLFVLAFFLLDGIFNEFVFVLLFIQSALLVFWLLPVFLYQVFIKKLRVKFAIYKALASYKEAIGHVSW